MTSLASTSTAEEVDAQCAVLSTRVLADKGSFVAFKVARVYHRGVSVPDVMAILTLEVSYASRVRVGESSALVNMKNMTCAPHGKKYKTSSYHVPGIEVVGPLETLMSFSPEDIKIVSIHDSTFEYKAGQTYTAAATDGEMSTSGCGKGLYFFLHPTDALTYMASAETLKKCNAVISKPLFASGQKGRLHRPFAIANSVLKPLDVVSSSGGATLHVVRNVVDSARGIVLVEDLGEQLRASSRVVRATENCVMCNCAVTAATQWVKLPGPCMCLMHVACGADVFKECGRCIYCDEVVREPVVEANEPEVEPLAVVACENTENLCGGSGRGAVALINHSRTKLWTTVQDLTRMRMMHVEELTRIEDDLKLALLSL